MSYDYKPGSLSLDWIILFFNMWVWCHIVKRTWPHVNQSAAGCDLSCQSLYASRILTCLIWLSSHRPVIQGLSRELVLNSAQSLHESIRLIHDFNSITRILFPLWKLVNNLSWPFGSSTGTIYWIFMVTPLSFSVYIFFRNQDILTFVSRLRLKAVCNLGIPTDPTVHPANKFLNRVKQTCQMLEYIGNIPFLSSPEGLGT